MGIAGYCNEWALLQTKAPAIVGAFCTRLCVCFQGQSGHKTLRCKCPLMAHSSRELVHRTRPLLAQSGHP